VPEYAHNSFEVNVNKRQMIRNVIWDGGSQTETSVLL
jgi:hypothetical protein